MASRVDTRRWIEVMGVRKANNLGLVPIDAANTPHLLHTLPIGILTTVKIRKIMWYNGVGQPSLLQIGYVTLAAAFVQVLPSILCPNGVDGELTELELPNYEFVPDTTLVTGTLGDIWAQVTVCPQANVSVSLEVEEIRQ